MADVEVSFAAIGAEAVRAQAGQVTAAAKAVPAVVRVNFEAQASAVLARREIEATRAKMAEMESQYGRMRRMDLGGAQVKALNWAGGLGGGIGGASAAEAKALASGIAGAEHATNSLSSAFGRMLGTAMPGIRGLRESLSGSAGLAGAFGLVGAAVAAWAQVFIRSATEGLERMKAVTAATRESGQAFADAARAREDATLSTAQRMAPLLRAAFIQGGQPGVSESLQQATQLGRSPEDILKAFVSGRTAGLGSRQTRQAISAADILAASRGTGVTEAMGDILKLPQELIGRLSPEEMVFRAQGGRDLRNEKSDRDQKLAAARADLARLRQGPSTPGSRAGIESLQRSIETLSQPTGPVRQEDPSWIKMKYQVGTAAAGGLGEVTRGKSQQEVREIIDALNRSGDLAKRQSGELITESYVPGTAAARKRLTETEGQLTEARAAQAAALNDPRLFFKRRELGQQTALLESRAAALSEDLTRRLMDAQERAATAAEEQTDILDRIYQQGLNSSPIPIGD